MNLRDEIIQLIQDRPGIQAALICRTINQRGLSYCTHKSCYANPRKRKKYVVVKPVCKFTLNNVLSKLNKLERDRITKSRREKKADARQSRGWDFMRASYLIKDFPEVLPQETLSTILKENS